MNSQRVRWSVRLILVSAFAGVIVGCKKPAQQAIAEANGSAPAATTRVAESLVAKAPVTSALTATAATVNAPAPSDVHVATDPFQPAVRFDPDRLPEACEAIVAVLLVADGRTLDLQSGFVFDADDRSVYVALADVRNRTSGVWWKGVDENTKFGYQAVVGSGSSRRVVPLEIARRYPASGGLVLSAPKENLPRPLMLQGRAAATPLGRRLQLIGHAVTAAPTDSKARAGFARVVVPSYVVPFGKPELGVPIWFGLHKPTGLRPGSGLVVADDGTVVALAHDAGSPIDSSQPTYNCFPTDCLRRYVEPELLHYRIRPRANAAKVVGDPTAGSPPQPVPPPTATPKLELDIGIQCVEYPRPLRRPRVLISSEPMKIQPRAPDRTIDIATWLHAGSVRLPVSEILDGKWSGQPADLQVAGFQSTPTIENLSLQSETLTQKNDRSHLPTDTNLTSYIATCRVASPASGKLYLQCIFDDEHGVTKLLGSEQVFDPNVRF